MSLPVLIPTFAAIANATLSALVFLNKPKASVNRLFALTALSAMGWAGTNALFQYTDSVMVATLAAQMSSVAALLMSASFLHFSWIYPLRIPLDSTLRDTILHRARLPLLWALTLLLSLLSLWPGVVDRSVELSGTHRIITAAGFYLVVFFLLLTAFAAFFTFTRQVQMLHGTLREQSLYVLAGAGVTAFFGTIFNLGFPLFGDYRFVWLGPSCSVVFVGATVYSIIAHHLFDIRLIIRRTVVYSLLLAGISAGYSAVEYLLTELINSQSPGATSPIFAHISGAIVVSLCVNPVRKWLERKIHHLLYPKHHSKHTIRHTTRRAVSNHETEAKRS